jgi:acrylyl-CoA reductase (NADPH)
MDLPSSVAPFILRAVALIGIDSVRCPQKLRREAWARLDAGLDRQKLAQITGEIELSGVIETARRILDGQVRGRLVVKIG